eukprot:TRINITY_DN6627_c0_g1_i1.p1 TRINITY_DN6627_c0_g1~~TRINITY_DN6627_c0_g1_i1.p1  ORF type:complete len:400 (+),score=103.65 TRINITY_DN6627_c0_g1_i1:60-1202(+)
MAVKYTDIDYVVFSDAARYITQGLSPYLRSTYRYTPLLAMLLTPNMWLHAAWGKLLFSACDLAIGALLYLALSCDALRWGGGLSPVARRARVLLLVCVWLFNPFAVNVSTRGNAESIISLQVLLCVYFMLSDRRTLSALMLGIAVHTKIYPVIYAPALFLFIPAGSLQPSSLIGHVRSFFSAERVKYTVVSAGTFFAITALLYVVYGYEYLFETYLYHVMRKDHRHNFSVYFYYMYLSGAPGIESASGVAAVLAFLPQLLLLVAFALVYHRDLCFCVFMQTLTFVAFNKVCTVQYFIWYFSLLPLVMATSSISLVGYGAMFLLWFAPQGLWLAYAYRLEFLGEPVFMELCIAGVLFFASNILIMLAFICKNRQLPLNKAA